jgi:hypothetical protein
VRLCPIIELRKGEARPRQIPDVGSGIDVDRAAREQVRIRMVAVADASIAHRVVRLAIDKAVPEHIGAREIARLPLPRQERNQQSGIVIGEAFVAEVQHGRGHAALGQAKGGTLGVKVNHGVEKGVSLAEGSRSSLAKRARVCSTLESLQAKRIGACGPRGSETHESTPGRGQRALSVRFEYCFHVLPPVKRAQHITSAERTKWLWDSRPERMVNTLISPQVATLVCWHC